MTIRELAPHISCVCTEDSLEEALSKYSEVYIVTVGGIFKHMKLRYDGRWLRAKVDSVPGVTSEIQEDLRFLPNDGEKIPYRLFMTIVAFFRKVMEVKKSDVEAHVHLLWNPRDGYYLAVPNQRVSKASVSYDYEHVRAEDIIVADFHSHNTMGAFFSGTDNNDDKNKTYYTGVVGDIKPSSFSVKLRFNFNEAKRECPLSEIFEIPPEEQVEVPKEWLDRIQVGYSYQGYQMGVGQANRVGTYHGVSAEEMEDLFPHAMAGRGYHGQLGQPVGTDSKKADASAGNKRRGPGSRAGATTAVGMNQETGCIEFPTLAAASGAEVVDFKTIDHDPTYIDYVTVQYGEKIANGFDQALSGLSELEEMDDLLEDIYREAADKLSVTQKARFGLPQVIQPISNRISSMSSDEFKANFLVTYGDDVATGFEQVVDGLNDINDCDEVLMEVVKHTVNKMSLKTQLELGVISTTP